MDAYSYIAHHNRKKVRVYVMFVTTQTVLKIISVHVDTRYNRTEKKSCIVVTSYLHEKTVSLN